MAVSRRWRFRGSDTLPALGTITDLAAALDGADVDLTWTPAEGAESHTVQRRAVGVATPTDTTVSDFIAEVDTRRAAQTLGALGATESDAWAEFWARLGNRDGEMLADRRDALVEAFVLRSAYNVGGGTEVVGLRGTVLTMSGAPAPAWGTAGMTQAAGTGVLVAPGGLLSSADVSIYAIAEGTGTPTVTQYLASQFPATGGAGSFLFGRSASNVNGVTISVRDSAVTFRSATSPAGHFAGRVAAMGIIDTTNTQIHAIPLPGNAATSFTNAAITAAANAAEPFRIGNNAAGDRPWIGSYSVVLLFAVRFTTASERLALDTIVRETIGAGLIA